MTVLITDGPWKNKTGELVKSGSVCKVRISDGKVALVPQKWVKETIPQSMDIDSGLGIGGINNDQSMPVIPSEAAIARAQRLFDTDIVCRKCGASKNFDGAMFTTGSGNVCDDCF